MSIQAAMAQALRDPGQANLAALMPGDPQSIQYNIPNQTVAGGMTFAPGQATQGAPTGDPNVGSTSIPYEHIVNALRMIPNIDFTSGATSYPDWGYSQPPESSTPGEHPLVGAGGTQGPVNPPSDGGSDLPTAGPSLPAPEYGAPDDGSPYTPPTPEIPNQQPAPAPAPSQPSGPTGGMWVWEGGQYDPFGEEGGTGVARWVPSDTQLGTNTSQAHAQMPHRYDPEQKMVNVHGNYWQPVQNGQVGGGSYYTKQGDDYIANWGEGNYRWDPAKGYHVRM